jgi:hypothetical protein
MLSDRPRSHRITRYSVCVAGGRRTPGRAPVLAFQAGLLCPLPGGGYRRQTAAVPAPVSPSGHCAACPSGKAPPVFHSAHGSSFWPTPGVQTVPPSQPPRQHSCHVGVLALAPSAHPPIRRQCILPASSLLRLPLHRLKQEIPPSPTINYAAQATLASPSPFWSNGSHFGIVDVGSIAVYRPKMTVNRPIPGSGNLIFLSSPA